MGFKKIDLWNFSRRDFLALSTCLITAMSLDGLSGAGIGHAAEIKFPEGKCEGKKNTKKKVLVTYASQYGSTGGVADAIGKELCSQGMSADVALIKHASHVGSYQGVVVGSAIYKGEWLPEALDFVQRNRAILRQVPVAYFLVCISLARPTDEKRAKALSYMNPVLKAAPEIRPVGIGTFAGALDYNNLSWLYQKILKSKGSPEGDFRDWDAIRTWAQDPVSAKFIRSEPKK
ncbi:MAG TPA: flavodoxin domain-containing protein [Syntrophales bacterium]|nr:flavodoxin domain-containing protein [Syntrophales bacterium]